MSRYFSLGRDGEAQWERLRRSYELVRRRAVVIATSPDRKVLSECRRRLADLSPKLLRAVPDQRVVETIHDLAAQHLEKKNLPVVWLESEGDRLSADELNEAWRHALSSLNVARERLADRGPVFLVLAGPPELLDLVGRRSPDLWSVANPVVHLGETLEDLVEGATTIDWLHLSDLHVRDPADWRHDVVVDQLRRDLPKLLDDAGLSPALVFVTGDLAWSGQKGELDQAHTFLKELLASLDLNPLHDLYAVPGNHDVDREAIGRMVRRDQAAVLELADEQFRGEVGEVLGNPADLALYGARLSAWCDFTGSLVGAARRVTPDRPWRTDIHPLGGLRVGIASLCSAWSCGPDDDRSGRIMLGERQVRTALDELRSAHLRLVLLHHPLEWLHDAERQAITGLLRSEAHAILHGHLHVAETVRTVGAAGELAVLASGAAYAGTGWKHGFQVARLDPAAAELAVHCFTWSERDGGFWHPDPGAARGAENGVVRLRLSVNTVAARGPASPAAGEGLAARLARAAVAVHGQLGFIGLPDHAPKPNAGLTDLFVPVSFIEEHGKEAWSLAELQADLFARGTDRTAARVVVLGDPGSGKSTLCRYQTVAAAGRDESPAPLLIPLREYLRQGRRDGLLAFAADEATQRLAVPVDESDLIALCKAGRALLLVDGLDEVVDPGDRERVRDMVQGVAHTYPGLAVMVTSRIVGYDQAPLNRKHFHHLRLAPFDDAQLDQFVTAWYEVAEPRDPVERSRRRGELLNALAAEPRARELARNPLFATLIALVHRYEATLPGQRAQLYELCVRMLLETWPSARGQRFPDLDEGRQRQVLERLALRMQEERGRRTKSDVTIGRSDLEQALIELLQEREFSDVPEGETRRLVTRWIDYLAARTGLLVEQQPTVFGFLHLSLMEYLAGRALFAREQAGGDDRLARFIANHHDQAQWRETLLLLLGSEATRGGLIDAVFDHLMKHPRWSGFTFLMELLREEVMLRPGQRDSVLSGAAELALDRRSYEWFVPRHTLGQVLDFSQRHADGVSTWFRDRLTSTTGRDLQGSLALIPQEGERAPPGPLAARTDLDSMLPALLELWPGNTWGTWAMEQANHETALAWLIQEPLDLIVWTALNCLRLHWSVGAAAHAAILGRRAGWVAAQILQAAESNSPRGRPGSVNDRQAKLRCSESAIVVDLRPATSVLPWDREEIVPKSLPWSRHSHIVDNITETKTKPWEQLHGATYLRAYLRRDSKGVKLATYSPIVHLNIEQGREKQNAGDDVLRPYKAMFALEASAALLDVQPSSERYVSELPLILSAIRIQNRWFHHFFKRFYIFGVANSPEHHALTLALALAQYQTTWQWPDCEGWQRFYTEEPPDHWLPAHFWHLCKAVDERDDPSHLQRAEKALERGEPPELVAALRRWMVRPTPTEKLALFRDPESRPT